MSKNWCFADAKLPAVDLLFCREFEIAAYNCIVNEKKRFSDFVGSHCYIRWSGKLVLLKGLNFFTDFETTNFL